MIISERKKTWHRGSDKTTDHFHNERRRMIMKKLLKEIEEFFEAYYKTFA